MGDKQGSYGRINMDRTERVELTALCMICRGNEILLQNRTKRDWPGYVFPGGHVEPGESIVESVIREMKEETGLTIRNPRLCGVKQFPIEGGRYIIFLFRADQFEGELCASEEGSVEWAHRDRLSSYALADDMEDLIKVMDSYELTEFQYIIEDGKWNVTLH